MFDPTALHADLLAYCARIGIAPTTFGQHVLKDSAFAASLQRGRSGIGKVALAQRFMREHPEALPRQFGAVAKAWRAQLAAEGEAGDGTGGEARHVGGSAIVVGGVAVVAEGLLTAGTLEESYSPHNRQFHADLSDQTGDQPGDPAAVAAILDQLGGDEAVAEGARVAITALEEMRAEGRVWSQYQRALVAFAQGRGYALDPVTLSFRPLGRDFARSA